jgi:ATP-dependent Clp protease ATP-binding subunit ClpA
MTNYSRYSHHARRALTHAGMLVVRYRHPRVDTGHLLVGVMLAKGSIGHAVLEELHLNAEHAAQHLEELTISGGEPLENPPNDAALDIALELAADESTWLGHHYIGTEHLLLGMTRTNLGNASDLLRLLNIAPEQVRNRVRRALNDGLTEFNLQLARRNARLSELSRRVINAAEQMAVAFDHPTVGLGHLLLVLLRERRSLASSLLHSYALDEVRVQDALDALDAAALVSLEDVLMRAVEQAQDMDSHYTGTEHLLLALTLDAAGADLLREFDILPEALRQAVERKLRSNR